MDEAGPAYETPEVRNYGDFAELTGHKGPQGAEDGCGKTEDGATCSQVM